MAESANLVSGKLVMFYFEVISGDGSLTGLSVILSPLLFAKMNRYKSK